MKELIPYYLVKFFGAFVRRLPLSWALALGRGIGTMAYYFDRKHTQIAYSNLRTVFAGKKSPDEIKRLTKEVFQHFGQNIMDLLRLPLLTRESFTAMVDVHGRENIDECLKKGKGVILLAMHFGSWEMANIYAPLFGYPYRVVVKLQDRNVKLDELINEYRACDGSAISNRGLGTRDIIKGLKENEVIGLILDQGGKDGIQVPFLGRLASMSDGALRIAIKMGTPICLSAIYRRPDGRHHLEINPPINIEDTGNPEEDIKNNLSTMVKFLERYIFEQPSQYMWFYKIWKYSKDSSIAILSDGKTGHVRQSQAVAREVQRALAGREIVSTVSIVDVKFKSDFHEKVFTLAMFFDSRITAPLLKALLHWAIDSACLPMLMNLQPEYVISTGSANAAVNRWWSFECRAKSIAVLKPGIMLPQWFDMLVLPEHDIVDGKHPQCKRLAVTKGAPNLIDDAYLKEQTKILCERYTNLKSDHTRYISLFIGGETKDISFDVDAMKEMVTELLNVTKMVGSRLLITTSRRTPATIETMLEKIVVDHPYCSLLIVANKHNVPEAVGGMLGLCETAVVSGDSISMISESASSGKNVVVFYPTFSGLTNKNKHFQFIDGLQRDEYVVAVAPEKVAETVLKISRSEIKTKRLNDHEAIYEQAKFVI